MQPSREIDVLVVCSANICRSPLAASALESAWLSVTQGAPSISVSSAGVDAHVGDVQCPQSEQLANTDASAHAVAHVQHSDLLRAMLIITLDRTQRAEVARMLPACRPRLFTLVQAALLAEHVGRPLELGIVPTGAGAVPDDPVERVGWLVAEMDAARSALAGMGEQALDIDDAHGPHDHADALFRVRDCAAIVGTWMAKVACMRT